jgi:DNA adenine methylase
MSASATIAAPTRPVLRWHGGKWRLAPWIIGHFPPHNIYVEPFGGAASVLLQKPRAASELYNDLDGDIVNLFRVLRDHDAAERLRHSLELTPWARDEFVASRQPADDPIERARRFVVQIMMGYGSAGRRKSPPGFRARTYCGSMTGAPDWRNYPDALPAITERFQGVIIENGDALDLLTREDSPDALFYADPPYLPATRSAMSSGMYAHEMDPDAHVALLERLRGLKGMVVLSGYASTLYDDALPDWRRVATAAVADGAEQRTEVLWVNPAAAAALDGATLQNDMFAPALNPHKQEVGK